MIRSEDIDDKTVVRIAVRKLLDVEEINHIFETIDHIVDEKGRRDLVLDLSNVEYLSSFVLGKLLMASKKVERAGGRLVLCHVSPHIRMLFQAQSKPMFEIYDDEQDALQSS